MFMGRFLPYFAFRSTGVFHFSNQVGGTQVNLYSPLTYLDNTWYFTCFTTEYQDPNTVMKMYIDGTLVNSGTFSGLQNNLNYTYTVGDGRNTSTWYPFNGYVSMVSVYDRTLSASEILKNYNAQVSRFSESYDADAQAFFTAAGITDTTQKTAVNQLVLDLKSYGVWSSMIAIYPFVGGSATSHKYNLKNTSTFTLSFNGGWTHTSTGSLPNGTNAYADTGISPSGNLGSNHNYSVYSRTDNNSDQTVLGSYELGGYVCGENGFVANLTLSLGANFLLIRDGVNGSYAQFSNTSTTGYFTVNRDSTTITAYKNGTSIGSSTSAQALSGTTMALSAAHVYDFDCVLDYYDSFDNKELAFVTFANSSLTSTNISNLNTAIQAFQTTLGRQI
jgi:hypothetical protein